MQPSQSEYIRFHTQAATQISRNAELLMHSGGELCRDDADAPMLQWHPLKTFHHKLVCRF